jgi:hypothetical protein
VNLRQRSGSAAGECPAGDGVNDTIQLMFSTQTYSLTSALVINRSVYIQGFGRTTSIIRSTAGRVFDIQGLANVAGPVVTLTTLAIENGRTDNTAVYGVYFNDSVATPSLSLSDVVIRGCTNGLRALGTGDGSLSGWKLAIENSKSDGLYCSGCDADLQLTTITGSQGSGIRNRSLASEGSPSSFVYLVDSVIDNNGSTSSPGGGIRVEEGGTASVIVAGSTISNNRGSDGGGVYSQGGLLGFYSSTISSNTAARGAGVFIASATSPGENNFYNVTLARNTASTRGGGLYVAGRQAWLDGTILGDNVDNGSGTRNPDCRGDVSLNLDGNMIENGTGCVVLAGGAWALQGQDLGLGPLITTGADSGAKAHFPLKASPIINTWWRETLTGTDQRGMVRPEPHFWPDGTLFHGFSWEPGAIEYNTTWHPTDLRVAGRSSGDGFSQPDANGYFRFQPNAVGDYVAFAVPISEAGTYDIRAHIGKMRDGGNYQLEVSNSLSGPFVAVATQDFYTQASSPVKVEMAMATVQIPASGVFTPGLRYFRFRVLGRAATSIGYQLRLAYLDVQKR